MTEEQRAALESIGVNIEETLERFVENEALLFKCMGKMLNDKNYDVLIEGIKSRDAKRAFEGAHALKGVTSNLGLAYVYDEAKVITEVFREGSLQYDEGNLERLEKAYNNAKAVICTIV